MSFIVFTEYNIFFPGPLQAVVLEQIRETLQQVENYWEKDTFDNLSNLSRPPLQSAYIWSMHISKGECKLGNSEP